MSNYSLSKVNKYKKLLVAQENYWDDELSVEFCIARRTREILLGRKIVDDFVQTKRSSQKKLVFDFALEKIWQEFFKTYVRNELQVMEFWGIFIFPSHKFATHYAKADEIWSPKILEMKVSGQVPDELKASFRNLLDIFREHRNMHF